MTALPKSSTMPSPNLAPALTEGAMVVVLPENKKHHIRSLSWLSGTSESILEPMSATK